MSKAWPKVRLGDVLTRRMPDTQVSKDGEYQFAGVYCFGRGVFRSQLRQGTEFAYSVLTKLRAGEFIYPKLMAWEGAFGLVPESCDGCYVSPEFPVFEINRDRLEPKFLDWMFKRPSMWQEIAGGSTGTNVRRQRLNPTDFLNKTIGLPPIGEQKRVLNILNKIVGKLSDAQALRGDSDQMTKLLPLAKLEILIAELNKSYGSKTIGSVLLAAGYGTSVKCAINRSKTAVPVLRIPNVSSENIILQDLKYGELESADRTRLKLEEGDVLVVRTNGSIDLVGRSAVVSNLSEDYTFASYMIRLRFDRNRVDPWFAQRMLKYLRLSGGLVDLARSTSGQHNVSLGRLRDGLIPVPPIAEQKRVLSELDSLQAQVDDLKRHQAETATELDALLPAILDKAFKGEL